jgi:hypothetical protein
VDKDTIEDLEAMKKNVVDDIKTAIEKKNEILKSLGDSAEKNTAKTETFVKPPDDDDDYEGQEEEEGDKGTTAVAEAKKEPEVVDREAEKVSYKKSDSYQVTINAII